MTCPSQRNMLSEQGYAKDSGYVTQEDVKFIVKDFDSILDIDFANCNQGDPIWVGNDNPTWNIYRHDDTDFVVEKVIGETEFTVSLTSSQILKQEIYSEYMI